MAPVNEVVGCLSIPIPPYTNYCLNISQTTLLVIPILKSTMFVQIPRKQTTTLFKLQTQASWALAFYNMAFIWFLKFILAFFRSGSLKRARMQANIEQEASAGDYFPSLCSLQIDGWSKLNCLPDQIQYISSSKDLCILDFPSLEVLPEWLGNLTSLRELRICGCENLNCMPSLDKMLCLTSLQQLKIRNCSLLEARCKQGGEESNKLFHIPKNFLEGEINPRNRKAEYERAEKVDPPIFARTMRERLDIDSDGEKIEGIDANGSDQRRHGGG
ncbi:hypothetical protein C5167_034910 [Papaver somniferum]|uniref:R13L1/DRL21-like LRR repeat region domain-containing protein n=1 Tax=Papaver somniferum TaxID=3469 RepID=A0A4Y7KEC9_PAPSO|nr:hypothetical protein C5167_034910 [Papaver somniferum]